MKTEAEIEREFESWWHSLAQKPTRRKRALPVICYAVGGLLVLCGIVFYFICWNIVSGAGENQTNLLGQPMVGENPAGIGGFFDGAICAVLACAGLSMCGLAEKIRRKP